MRQPLAMALAAVYLALGLLSSPAFAKSILTQWGLKPKYDSSYRVNRTKTIWDQSLKFDRKSGIVRFKTKLNSENTKDKARNDLDRAKNNALFRLSRRMGFGEVFGVGELKWDRKENQRSLRVIHNNNFDLGSGVKLLQRERGSLDLTLSGGGTHKMDINQQTSTRSSRVDSTEATGWSGGSRMSGSWDPSKEFSFNGSGNYHTSAKDSRNTRTEADADTTIFEIQTATDRGRSLDTSAEGLWTRFEAFNLLIKGSYADRSSQYYYAPKSAQETMSSQTVLAALTVEGDPIETFHYGIDLRAKESRDDYDLQDRDGFSSSTDLYFSARHELGLPLVAGAVARAKFVVSDGRRESQNQTSYDTKRK
ncbi:MAG: hypothetical protein KAY24_10735, partial [Candidatus Eisenbacteria sp.]|nr:hypothetical protein [Candidatus Eisenbacteria bacterium]